LEALLGPPAGLAEDAVVLVEAFDQRLGDCLGDRVLAGHGIHGCLLRAARMPASLAPCRGGFKPAPHRMMVGSWVLYLFHDVRRLFTKIDEDGRRRYNAAVEKSVGSRVAASGGQV